jgi:hypothetical protein
MKTKPKTLRLTKVEPAVTCELLTDVEFANRLGVCVATLRESVANDEIACRHIMVGKRRRWPVTAVGEFLNGRN